jgi:diaminohydroxyphosphoribosylaminopyrimidine deaminase / 5-amino-6-(5-phosphoribosylamino)uracil reductase
MSGGPSPFAWLLPRAGGGEDQRWTLDGPAPAALAPQSALSALDGAHLERAFEEALRGVGRTAPNPPVGAVVARGAEVLATGFHARAGERHAEVVALDAVAGGARGATLYVTLEPCVHQGRTPPCADRILAEGIDRVVIGALDPNPRVHEKGVARLREAGVPVELAGGALGARCRALVTPFSASRRGRPFVILKIAASLDGRVATRSGASRWITGPAARALVHRLRDAVDAVIVGAGTVVADDPALTVRLPDGQGRSPRRVVIDSRLRTSPGARVFARHPFRPGESSRPPLVVHGDVPPERRRAFDEASVARLEQPGADGRVDLEAALGALAGEDALAVLVEAGPGLAGALLRADLVDELWWFTAPIVLGADALGAVSELGLFAPGDAPRWTPIHRASVDDDGLVVLAPRRA